MASILPGHTMIDPTDPYLQTSLGMLDGTDPRVSAVCGGMADTPADDLLIVLHRAQDTFVIRAAPLVQITGPALAPGKVLVIEQHHAALTEHWIGRIDSVDLTVRMIEQRAS